MPRQRLEDLLDPGRHDMARMNPTVQKEPVTSEDVIEWLNNQNLGTLLSFIEWATAAIRKREHARAAAVRQAVEEEMGPTTSEPALPGPGVPE